MEEEIPPEKYFYVHDGTIIRCIDELPIYLTSMDEQIFVFHVTEEKNDFASWIMGVFNESLLAEKVQNSKTKDEMINIIGEYMESKIVLSVNNYNSINADQPAQQIHSSLEKYEKEISEHGNEELNGLKSEELTAIDSLNLSKEALEINSLTTNQEPEKIKKQEDQKTILNQNDTKDNYIYTYKRGEKNQNSIISKAFFFHYDELKKKISEKRKKGYDTSHCNLLIMQIPSKIKLLEHFFSEKESLKLIHLFYIINEELNILTKKEMVLA
ncbi:MAG: hypothetical protein V1859_01660 [archaeon]